MNILLKYKTNSTAAEVCLGCLPQFVFQCIRTSWSQSTNRFL